MSIGASIGLLGSYRGDKITGLSGPDFLRCVRVPWHESIPYPSYISFSFFFSLFCRVLKLLTTERRWLVARRNVFSLPDDEEDHGHGENRVDRVLE